MRAVITFLALIVFMTALPALASMPNVGEAAPALVIPRTDGEVFDLSKLKGKVVILHFWATWCAPCREEMPELAAYYQRANPKNVEVLAISVDRKHDIDNVKAVLHPLGFHGAMYNAATSNDWGSPSGIPATYVIDREGVVKAVMMPDTTPLTESALTDAVKPLLSDKK
ncbi:MAG: TlpA family protein disulfide reductase [Alphaproteobacteria bacterium]|nr:TlpA family protein disulfide reductase [Alphaproteobacteria bacterium]